ncbi:MAG TPA: DUF6596 domain-containing protein [Falsiroseomonas sp.]|nr:DUF6596 domain-containing protein [Falsiroseomonas sp.]
MPEKPEAWLLTAARRRLLDGHRRAAKASAALPDLLRAAGDVAGPEEPEQLPDHRLALLLACAAEGVEPAARAPLMLQCVLGLDAARIASAFLVSPAAMGQRLVRAKVAARLSAALAPEEPEAAGLAALLPHLEARRPAARDAAGAYVPLSAQDPSRWNAPMQAEAERLLRPAATLGRPGRFQWEAAVQSVHAARRFTGRTDWAAIRLLYDALLAATGSPVVAVNRAVAVAETEGAAAGLRALRAAGADRRLAEYQPYWAALAALAARAGEMAAAEAARQRAAGWRPTRPCAPSCCARPREAGRLCRNQGGQDGTHHHQPRGRRAVRARPAGLLRIPRPRHQGRDGGQLRRACDPRRPGRARHRPVAHA